MKSSQAVPGPAASGQAMPATPAQQVVDRFTQKAQPLMDAWRSMYPGNAPKPPSGSSVDVSPNIPIVSFASENAGTTLNNFGGMLQEKLGTNPIARAAEQGGPGAQELLADPVNNNPLIDALRNYRTPARPAQQSMGGWQSLMQRMQPR